MLMQWSRMCSRCLISRVVLLLCILLIAVAQINDFCTLHKHILMKITPALEKYNHDFLKLNSNVAYSLAIHMIFITEPFQWLAQGGA